MSLYRKLIVAALLLTVGVVALGAYVRLSDAGLGCPDWPGCYGRITPQHASERINEALAQNPHGPVSHAKAWKEMMHRYFAGTLGLLVLGIAVLSIKHRNEAQGSPLLPIVLFCLIVFQALLGMWTVTELLKPFIVTAHLVGGMTTLALLAWLWQRECGPSLAGMANVRPLRMWGVLALAAVAIQIVLGGWVSTNYAALACQDFPLCHGEWVPEMHFEPAFTLHRELGMDAAGNYLSLQALTAIHWTHRLWAAAVLVLVGIAAVKLARQRGLCVLGLLLGMLLLIQLGMGIANIWLSLPLALAVAHNAGAALLLLSLVVINYRLFRMR
ncbi:MAG: COX15/CtaA family protein [Pseudomonadota bacterium]